VVKREYSTLSLFLILILSAFLFSFGMKIWRPVDYHQIKIEVLNGCGVNNLARNTTRYLRENGFDVTFYGNARDRIKNTVIVDKLYEKEKWARIVGRALDVDIYTVNIDSTRCVNVIIILGMDYDSVLPKEILNRR